MRARTLAAASLSLLLTLGLAACGDDDDDDDDSGSSDTTTAADDGGETADTATDATEGDGGEAAGTDCTAASEAFSAAVNPSDPSNLDSYADAADDLEALGGDYPDIAADLTAIADLYRAVADGDSAALADANLSTALTNVTNFFVTECSNG